MAIDGGGGHVERGDGTELRQVGHVVATGQAGLRQAPVLVTDRQADVVRAGRSRGADGRLRPARCRSGCSPRPRPDRLRRPHPRTSPRSGSAASRGPSSASSDASVTRWRRPARGGRRGRRRRCAGSTRRCRASARRRAAGRGVPRCARRQSRCRRLSSVGDSVRATTSSGRGHVEQAVSRARRRGARWPTRDRSTTGPTSPSRGACAPRDRRGRRGRGGGATTTAARAGPVCRCGSAGSTRWRRSGCRRPGRHRSRRTGQGPPPPARWPGPAPFAFCRVRSTARSLTSTAHTVAAGRRRARPTAIGP